MYFNSATSTAKTPTASSLCTGPADGTTLLAHDAAMSHAGEYTSYSDAGLHYRYLPTITNYPSTTSTTSQTTTSNTNPPTTPLVRVRRVRRFANDASDDQIIASDDRFTAKEAVMPTKAGNEDEHFVTASEAQSDKYHKANKKKSMGKR